MLAELAICSLGGPVISEDLPSTQQLLQAALYEPADTTRTAPAAQDMDWVPTQYRQALDLHGVTTTHQLLMLSTDQLCAVQGIGASGVRAIDEAHARYSAARLTDLALGHTD
ncbi:hypothetical protein [Nocardia sp. NPDC006630]|uniref:hypothetical protein n=1 Tax=Nocardia sp. NPDC006630 TaxID=3157181 RepID=UPI0033A1168D